MTSEERENVLHCLKVIIGEEVCEECNLYGTTGTDHCGADCVRMAIKALEQEPVLDKIRTEIEEKVLESLSDGGDDWFTAEKVNECLEIIDKYRQEVSE